MTLQKFWNGAVGQGCAILPVVGDCMERLDIHSGDMVRVDFTRRPLPPKYLKRDGLSFHDAVLCYGAVGNKSPHRVVFDSYFYPLEYPLQVKTH